MALKIGTEYPCDREAFNMPEIHQAYSLGPLLKGHKVFFLFLRKATHNFFLARFASPADASLPCAPQWVHDFEFLTCIYAFFVMYFVVFHEVPQLSP